MSHNPKRSMRRTLRNIDSRRLVLQEIMWLVYQKITEKECALKMEYSAYRAKGVLRLSENTLEAQLPRPYRTGTFGRVH